MILFSNVRLDKSDSLFSCKVALSVSKSFHPLQVIQAAGREGATFIDQWFVGCRASHVVCEGSSSRKYLGHSSNIVTVIPASHPCFYFIFGQNSVVYLNQQHVRSRFIESLYVLDLKCLNTNNF